MSSNLNAAATSHPEPMMEMNMTPMIDVMLVLIIMFIMVLPIAENAVSLDMPSHCGSNCAKPEVVRIAVDFDDTLSWNGVMLTRAELDAKFDALAALPSRYEVQLQPNRHAAYKTVAGVLASAQSRGITTLGIIGSEQFLTR